MNTYLQYPGSKNRIAGWIVKNMPEHHSYVEPFFGSGAVLFKKSPSRIETINDLDGDVVNFFRVVQDQSSRERLGELVAFTPYSREEYEKAYVMEPKDEVERAWRFVVKVMQGHGFRLTEKTGWKKDVQGRESCYALRHWNKLPEILQYIGLRLKDVQIENLPAIEVIRNFNFGNVLIYCDPPYVLSTRTRKQYRHEMSDDEHEELLYVLCGSKAKVMLSGYDNPLYEKYLRGWRKEKVHARAQNNSARVETLWMNYGIEEKQMSLII